MNPVWAILCYDGTEYPWWYRLVDVQGETVSISLNQHLGRYCDRDNALWEAKERAAFLKREFRGVTWKADPENPADLLACVIDAEEP